MGLFICEKCGCVENTALGHYWSRKDFDWYNWDEANEKFKGKALCSECGPKSYCDTGEPTKFGKWHGKFDKEHVIEHLKKYPNSELKNINVITNIS